MKKITTGIALLSTVILLAGCGGNNGSNNSGFDFDRTINMITREEGSGTRGAFVELFELEETQADGSKTDLITKEASVENNTNSILSTVQNDRYAIGYISMGSLNDDIKALEIDGRPATPENVKNGSYTISRPFNIATNGETSGVTKDFIDFILSAEGQEVVGNSYISVGDNLEPYAGNKESGSITVGGSSSVAPLMEKLIERYRELNPNANVELQISDSSIGMTQTMEGAYDIGMSSRSLRESESQVLSEVQIALDGIAVIVNKENEITGLNKEDVRSIYLMEAETWSEVQK
jgi:ABC-type phosphate transport system, periplasmic component